MAANISEVQGSIKEIKEQLISEINVSLKEEKIELVVGDSKEVMGIAYSPSYVGKENEIGLSALGSDKRVSNDRENEIGLSALDAEKGKVLNRQEKEVGISAMGIEMRKEISNRQESERNNITPLDFEKNEKEIIRPENKRSELASAEGNQSNEKEIILDNNNISKTEKLEIERPQNREVKISNLYVGNLRKELQEFVDLSKDVKMANNKMIVNIRPVEFGNLEIVFVKNKEFVNIQIQVESAKVLSSIEDVVEDIKNNLESKEIRVEISVKEKELEGEKQDEKQENNEKKKEERGNPDTKGEKLNQFEELISEMLGEIQ